MNRLKGNESGCIFAGALAFFACFGGVGAVGFAPLHASSAHTVEVAQESEVLDFVGALSSPYIYDSVPQSAGN